MGNILLDAWGYCDNDKYKVRLTGASIYVFDNAGNQLFRFKDIPNAYKAKFKPSTNVIVAKSTAGYIAFYDLDKMSLLKKIKIGLNYSQDDGFDFSTDGKYLYNIERIDSSIKKRLSIYDAGSYSLLDTLFTSDSIVKLDNIECSEEGTYLLFVSLKRSYICELVDNMQVNKVEIPFSHADQLSAFLSWRDSGFSEKRNKWDKECGPLYFGPETNCTLAKAAKMFRNDVQP